jgi:flagellar M-ring protein FliF
MNFNMLFEQIVKLLDTLTMRQRLIVGISTLLVIAFIVFLVVYTSRSSPDGYSVLFEGINSSDSALIIDHLEKENIPYEIVNEGTISVPSEVVYKQRISIAALGIPKSSRVGFELFDKQDFGETEFAQRIKYLRALEGELSRTILSLVPIKDAKVHIAIPKESVFVEKETKPTASVVVSLQPSMKLSFSQITGIKNLVSSSVPKMSESDVSIVDDSGNPLGEGSSEEYDSQVVESQIRYKKEYERAYESKIEDVLAPILGGKDSVVAKVNIDFDFQQKKIKSEYFDPESVIRSEKSVEEKRDGASKKEAKGVPGAISNIGPIEPQDSGQVGEKYEKNSITTNYEISKKITDIKGEFATIKRLSVAVVVDGKYKTKLDEDGNSLEKLEYQPLTKQQLADIADIVRNSVGYDKKRGDSVSVNNLQFSREASQKDIKNKLDIFIVSYINPFLPILKYLFVAILLLIFYRVVIAPFGKKMLEDYNEEVVTEDLDIAKVDEEDNSSLQEYDDMKKKIESELGLGENVDPESIKHDVLISKLRTDVETSSEEIAKIITTMLDNRKEL